VSGSIGTGALAGANAGNVTAVSVSGGSVSGTRFVGGLVGSNAATGTINASSSLVNVNGTLDRTGGLVGWNAGALKGDSAHGHTTGVDAIGGLVGWNEGNVSLSSASGETTGSGYGVGGLVGYSTTVGILFGVDATGTVDGSGGGLGGLVGLNTGSIANAFATGTVGLATTHTAGGLIGNNAGSLFDVYAAGIVHGATTATGALIGANQTTSTITNAYYDALVTGALPSIGNNFKPGANPHSMNASHPPTSQSTYVGFDFSAIWTISPGNLPTLR
jgi:hypothetical protein